MKNIAQLGQVFTPPDIVRRMILLRKNRGRILEPSAGDGAFLRELSGENAVGIEIDSRFAKQSGARCMDFFDYPESQKFDTIIGNPPYIRHRDILAKTRAKLPHEMFDGRSNLYLFFMEKCLRHLADGGEIIFITPRDFIKATAARRLNRLLFDGGTITDFIDLGDLRVFSDASPNCAIWRFAKGDFSRKTNGGREKFLFDGGQIFFARREYAVSCRDVFQIKVGAVSGMDFIFADEKHGNRDFVCSKTAADGKTRRMIYGVRPPVLRKHKSVLIARKIRKFDETNWWQWGRAHFDSPRPRIYVNAKTRRANPFFLHPARDYDGSVLAVFPHDENADLQILCDMLNAVNWRELGFVCGGRFLFSQRSLQNCLLPKSFARFAGAKKAA